MIKAGQQIEVMIADYAEIDVRRPNGSVETIKYSAANHINPALFETMKKATKAAGRGDLLAYRNIQKSSTYTYTVSDELDAAHDAVVAAMTLNGKSK